MTYQIIIPTTYMTCGMRGEDEEEGVKAEKIVETLVPTLTMNDQ